MNNSIVRWIQLFIVIQILFFVTACREKNRTSGDGEVVVPYCQIENIREYHNGLSFLLKMSLNFDCFDMDEFVFTQKLFRPYWIEIIEDTLFMKKILYVAQ